MCSANLGSNSHMDSPLIGIKGVGASACSTLSLASAAGTRHFELNPRAGQDTTVPVEWECAATGEEVDSDRERAAKERLALASWPSYDVAESVRGRRRFLRGEEGET